MRLWPWSRLVALEEVVVSLSVRVKELEDQASVRRAFDDNRFEEVRMRLSNSEQNPEEISVGSKPSDWLMQRKVLESKYASKETPNAK